MLSTISAHFFVVLLIFIMQDNLSCGRDYMMPDNDARQISNLFYFFLGDNCGGLRS